jgi:hypothetical protein
MNTEKYIVRLCDEERQELHTIVKKQKGSSQKINRATVLLQADPSSKSRLETSNNQIIHEPLPPSG